MRKYQRHLTEDEMARRAAERRAADPQAYAAAEARRTTAVASPATLAATLHQGFVPFQPGGVVGWIVEPTFPHCWLWTGKFRSSPVVHFEGRSRSVARILKARALGVPELAPTDILVKICGVRGCVAPLHHALLAPSVEGAVCPHCGGQP